MKLLITGYARHGKDTVCEILRNRFGLKFVSSSYFVAECAVRPYLAERGIVYESLEECYADRVNHRPAWHDAILEYNTPDRARLARELFAQNDIYCGLRNLEEFQAVREQKLFDFSIWIDRIDLVPPEGIGSMQIRREHCDFVLDNNSTLTGLRVRTIELYHTLQGSMLSENCLLQPRD